VKPPNNNSAGASAQTARLISIDFAKGSRNFLHLGGGVYRDPRTSNLYENPKIDGRRTWRKLQANTHKFALKELRKRRSDQELAKLGLAIDPYKRTADKSVAALCQFYIDQGCPKRNRAEARTGRLLLEERRRAEMLAKWPGAKKSAREITPEDWATSYYPWRKKSIRTARSASATAETGDRQIDKELITLSNIFHFAIVNRSKTGIETNPITSNDHEFPRFRKSSSVRHCRDAMPRTGNELHAIARFLFESGTRSEVLGWFELLTARIGHRAEAMTKLRIDATGNEPGSISNSPEGRKLHLHRSTTHKGTCGHIDIDPDFQECLDAHRAWLWRRHPNSPWYFPSPADPAKPIGPAALTHALDRVCAALGLPKRTTHGLRAFRVNVLRSQGKSDAEVALAIGQKTAGKLIVEVYGEGLSYKLTWMPTEGPPAWVRDHHSLPSPDLERYIQPDLPLPRMLVQGELPLGTPIRPA
jgi:integrase